MSDQFSRTLLQFGKDNMERLYGCRVAVFGVGGVGGYCVEALCRCGIGAIDIFDNDRVCLTNLNRQIIATRKTIGRYKVDVMKEHILEINPDASVGAYKIFYLPEMADEIDLSAYDYIIDAVDTVTAKLELVCRAVRLDVPVISSMGAANKLDPAAFMVADIYETSICPMARVMRRELRKRGIDGLKVVYSKEPPVKLVDDIDGLCQEECISASDITSNCARRKQTPASNSFVPPVVGFIMAGEVIKDLINIKST